MCLHLEFCVCLHIYSVITPVRVMILFPHVTQREVHRFMAHKITYVKFKGSDHNAFKIVFLSRNMHLLLMFPYLETCLKVFSKWSLELQSFLVFVHYVGKI
jgi:hypothetical protein